MSWDGFQREVLAELGHVLYVPLHARQAGAQAAMGAIDEAMLARIARAAGVDAEGLRAHADIAAASAGKTRRNIRPSFSLSRSRLASGAQGRA